VQHCANGREAHKRAFGKKGTEAWSVSDMMKRRDRNGEIQLHVLYKNEKESSPSAGKRLEVYKQGFLRRPAGLWTMGNPVSHPGRTQTKGTEACFEYLGCVRTERGEALSKIPRPKRLHVLHVLPGKKIRDNLRQSVVKILHALYGLHGSHSFGWLKAAPGGAQVAHEGTPVAKSGAPMVHNGTRRRTADTQNNQNFAPNPRFQLHIAENSDSEK
jgi:hypothetical protein